MWKEGRRYDDMHICVLMLRNKAMYNIVLVGKYIWDVLSSFPHPFACTWWLFCHSYTDLFFTVAHCYCWNFYVLLLLTVTLFTFFHHSFKRIWPTRCSGFESGVSQGMCSSSPMDVKSYIFRNDFTLEWCRPSRIEQWRESFKQNVIVHDRNLYVCLPWPGDAGMIDHGLSLTHSYFLMFSLRFLQEWGVVFYLHSEKQPDYEVRNKTSMSSSGDCYWIVMMTP